MKKELLDLSTHEFVAVLLSINPKQSVTISFDSNNDGDVITGTYDELLALSRDRLHYPGNVLAGIMDELFDYQMVLNNSDTIRYLIYRTDNFNPELTAAFLYDMKQTVSETFRLIEDNLGSPEEFEKWKEASTSQLNMTLDYLERKSKEIVGMKLDASEPVVPTIDGDRPCAVIIHDYMKKAASLFKNGRWHNDRLKEYAIFLRCLYCKASHVQWDDVRYTRWKILPILPLANGKTPTGSMLSDALKGYSDAADGGVRKRYEDLLTE